MFTDVQAFVKFLEDKGELIRITTPVTSDLEITEVADRVMKAGGPALLFENVTGKDYPVAIGLMGTRQRMAWALGVNDLEDIPNRLRKLLDIKLGGGILGLASNLPKLKELANLPPRRVKTAPVQEVVWRGDEVDLSKIPVLKCWPLDGGPFVTLPLVITNDPETGEMNMGMYRMQVMSKNTTGMHWQRHKTGARHLEKARKLGRKLEVAVAIGGDPALIYAATAPIPPVPGINEYSLTGFLRSSRQEVVKGVTVNLEVPANAEFILEGYVDPHEATVMEGPFGDHTGFYTLEDEYPLFHVTAVTMRRGAIYPATIVGRPPMEDAFMIETTERIFLVPAQLILPEIADYHLPPCGIAHNLVNVTIKKSYPGQAYKVANGMFGLGQAMFTKVAVVCDAGSTKPQNNLDFWKTALLNCVPGRDTAFTKGPTDVLDHSSREWSYGSKLIVDGTKKSWEEGGEQSWQPAPPRAASELPKRAGILEQSQPGGGLWFVSVNKTQPRQGLEIGEALAVSSAASGIRLIALVDELTDVNDDEDVFWTLLNNIDPERDSSIVNGPTGPVLVMDGTRKIAEEGFTRAWPQKIVMDAAVVALVDEKWAQYGIPGAKLESPTGHKPTRPLEVMGSD
ncbi:MAG: menaquinone biosynthesis decarboxylase [Pleurocapsa sp. SU_196_0]|nr:menaquinone biosynthesis decarboxylase [Pleurocapsa sp. SU_196_0]